MNNTSQSLPALLFQTSHTDRSSRNEHRKKLARRYAQLDTAAVRKGDTLIVPVRLAIEDVPHGYSANLAVDLEQNSSPALALAARCHRIQRLEKSFTLEWLDQIPSCPTPNASNACSLEVVRNTTGVSMPMRRS